MPYGGTISRRPGWLFSSSGHATRTSRAQPFPQSTENLQTRRQVPGPMPDSRHVALCEKHYPFPPDHGRATRLVTLAKALRNLGFQVTLLVSEGESTTLQDGT